MLSRRFLCKVALPLIGTSYLLGTMQLFGAMNGSDYHRRLCSYMDNMAWEGTSTTRYLADSVYTVTCTVYYPEPPSIHDVDGDGSLEPTPVPRHRRWGGRRDDVSIFDVYARVEEHSPTGRKEPQTGTVAYALVLTSCPEDKHAVVDNDYDPGAQFYDASAITKHAVCNCTVEGNVEYPFTLYAFVHPEAVVCETPTGGTYDRVKMLQDLGYWVEIVGEAVTHDDLRDTQPYLSGHIFDDDVGIRDLIRLRLWQLISHPIVVMMDWNTLMMKPLNDVFETLTNSDIPAMYVRNGDNEGVSTGLMLIKPSNDEFEKMKNAYINTPYDPVSGWNNEGHNDFPGKMGMSGFLSYYYSKTDAVEIDRCLYGNGFASICENTRFDDVIVGRFAPNHCAAPWTCPDYDGEVNESCKNIHSKFYKYRYDFETNHWSKKKKPERVGKYHVETFMGYCKGKGKDNYVGMTQVEPMTTQDEPEDEPPTVEGECRSACARINDWDTMCPNKACRACPECVVEPPTEPKVTVKRKKPKKRPPTEPEDEIPTEPEVEIPTELENETPTVEGECRSACARIDDWDLMCKNKACKACSECVVEPPTEPPTEPKVTVERKKPKKRPPTEPEVEIPAEPEVEIPAEPEVEIPAEPEVEIPTLEGECRQPACNRIGDWDLMCKNLACRGCAECADESLTSHTTNRDETLAVLRDECRPGCANVGNWEHMCQSKSCAACPECTGEPMTTQDEIPTEPQGAAPTEPPTEPEKPEDTPEWKTVCPTKMKCPAGSYVTKSCECTAPEDPCAACPLGTQCQLKPTLMCIDCECGFCNRAKESCCRSNGHGNCVPASNAKECRMQDDFFAAFPGSGNTCSGSGTADVAVNGCGCQPSATTPCNYDPLAKNDKCYVCTAHDLALGLCSDCKTCLSKCDDCISKSKSTEDYQACLGSKDMAGKGKGESCRSSCAAACLK